MVAAVASVLRTTVQINRRKLMATRSCFSYLVLFIALSTATAKVYVHKCVYTFYVKTGEIQNAGTDSNIGLNLIDSGERSIEIRDLRKVGLMGSGHDYFERGNLDIFSLRETCLEPPICKLKLISDRKGSSPGWFVEYVEIGISRPDGPCIQLTFAVNKWLGVSGPPFEITVILNGCGKYIDAMESAMDILD